MSLLPGLVSPPALHRAIRRKGTVQSVLIADGQGFETRAVPELLLDADGIAGDRHHGPTRAAGGREPWYPRGTIIRNDRAVSLVAPDDLADIAHAMDIAAVRPEWLGANIVIESVAHFSYLPAGTRIFFDGGAVLVVTAQNKPCRYAGAALARHNTGREGLDLLFPQKAQGLRGLVASVERPGPVQTGMSADIRVPEQWIYGG